MTEAVHDHRGSVGIDVSKFALDVAFDPDKPIEHFAYTKRGQWALARRLLKHPPARIVLEATGGYERSVLEYLHKLKLPVVRVNPRQVRDFAKATGILAKTDGIDARVLARFGSCIQPVLRPPPSEHEARLREIVLRRKQLVEFRTSEKNRLQQDPCPVVLRSIRRMITNLDKQIDLLEAEIADLIAQEKQLQARIEILRSVPGVGLVNAATILSGMPELGTLSRQAVASLAGLAPFNNDSGQFRGRRTIRGGRSQVRTALYMSALNAIRKGGVMRETYQRHVANGKAPKVALTACMRKLLTIINALVRERKCWGEGKTDAPPEADE